MGLTSGSPEVIIGLIDGPIAIERPDLAKDFVRELPGGPPGTCPISAPGTLVTGKSK